MTGPGPIVGLRAALRDHGRSIAVSLEGGRAVETSHESGAFDTWCSFLSNQRDRTESKRSDFVERSRKEAANMAAITPLDDVCAGIASLPPAPALVLLRVELSDRALDKLPWELLSLALEDRLAGRRVCVFRTVTGMRRREKAAPALPARILLAETSPMTIQSTNAAPEFAAAQQNLGHLVISEQLQPGDARASDAFRLRDAMSTTYRLIHLTAHGEPGQVIFGEGREAQRVPGKTVAEWFNEQQADTVALLSICMSVIGTADQPSAARAIAEAGIPAVLGMYGDITQQAAETFFDALYKSLGRNEDMLTAYADAILALRESSYPNCGFWSVPVLYSKDNVIPFPRRPGIPDDAYSEYIELLVEHAAEIAEVAPKESWKQVTWTVETMGLRMETRRRLRAGLQKLITAVEPAARVRWRWARDVDRAARSALTGLDLLIEAAEPTAPGAQAVARFDEDRKALLDDLRNLHRTLSALRRFAP
ncbi:CHAT domain-containing protein [Nonomuraea wenchangensis]|uniref:CHAT domain-containing protein n=1 Tax=Nonomuraea wenchangensis TaxID=568860 RepID=UPI003324FDC7